jgi:hypothetical protein
MTLLNLDFIRGRKEANVISCTLDCTEFKIGREQYFSPVVYHGFHRTRNPATAMLRQRQYKSDFLEIQSRIQCEVERKSARVPTKGTLLKHGLLLNYLFSAKGNATNTRSSDRSYLPNVCKCG